MPWWEWSIDLLGLAVVLFLLYGLALMLRRHLVCRGGGTFELSFRARDARPGRGWVLGLGRYSGGQLEWFRVFSLSPRPGRAWDRRSLRYLDTREPEGPEQLALQPDHVVIACDTPQENLEIAMSRESLMGFQAWLESGPPGADWSR